MSGALTSLVGGTFAGLLQEAYWRGIPFFVDAQQVHKGRKVAVHDYPFRDGGWVEDMGRAQQVFRFTGHLIGDLAPVMQLALDAACEIPGPGLLIHPTLGALNVALMSASSSVRKDAMRVISVEFVFMEQGSSLFPSIITQTIGNVLSAVGNAIPSFVTDLLGFAVFAAAAGLAASTESGAVVGSFTDSCTAAATDPAALVSMAAGIPPTDANTTYGRYAAGNASTALPAGTTVASLQAQIATQRNVVAAAVTAATSSATSFGAATATTLVSSVSSVIEATRATMTNPADQIRTLLQLIAFTYTDNNGGAGLSGDVATVRDAMATMCRRCVVASLAQASASYQPLSYDDAANIRTLVAAAMDNEITAAGDAGDDASYAAMRAIRVAVVQDLTTRGASLPVVETVTLPMPLPSLVVAYRLYKDSSRSDQIAAETGVPHPAFCPTIMQVLAS